MVSVTDDFNRADSVGAGLGANWNSPYGTSNRFDVVSNRAQATGTGTCLVMHATAMTGADHTVQATYGTGSPVSLIARYDGTGNSDGTAGGYYRFHYNGSTLQLGKKPAGSSTVTTIGSAFTVTLVAGDLMKLEVVGTAINGYLNGTLVCSGTDATITAGTRVGMRSATVATNALDNFAAADYAAGSQTIAAPPASASATAPTPTIDAQGGSAATIVAPPAAATASAVAPTIATSGAGVAFSDNFNRVDAPNLGSSTWGFWTTRWAIVSNTARPQSTSICLSWYLTPTATDDVEVQATLAAFTSGNISLMARFDGTGTDTSSAGAFYGLRYDGTALSIQKHVALAASTTQLASTTTTVNVGDVVRFRVNGGVLTGYVNGTQVVTVTDPTPITGQRLHGLRSGASSTGDAWDDWSVADLALVGSPTSITAPPALAQGDMPVPTITAPGPTTIVAPDAAAAATMPNPVIDTVTTFTGSPAAATATMPAPTIATAGGPQTIAAIAAAASAVMPAPTIAATATIAAPVALATASAPSPVLVLDPPIGRRNVDFIRFDGSVMRLDRQETEFYDPQPVTVPTLGAWEASFDGGVTWVQPEVLNGRPLWLVTYGGDTSSGATVVPRTNVLPKLRDADNPETLVENGPRIIVV